MKTSIRKKVLLATAAVAVMGVGAISKPAMAFDEVNWTWENNVMENITKDINVTIDSSPTGVINLEKIQFQVGDVNATSTVTNFTNNPPGDGGAAGGPAPGPVVYTLDLLANYDDNTLDNPITNVELLNGDETGLSISGPSGSVDNNLETINMTFDLTVPEDPAGGPVPIAIGERLGVDLPKVASAATAVGNNQTIESSVSMELHDAQYLVGDVSGESSESLAGLFDQTDPVSNTHTNAVSSLVAALTAGGLTPASITADSTVTGILNATVDSNATAVGNNMSVDLAAFTPDDAFVIADVAQFAYADVTATSLVDDVMIDGYSDLGAAGFGPAGGLDPDTGLAVAQIPVINSVATAVGNNFSLKVTSPAGL